MRTFLKLVVSAVGLASLGGALYADQDSALSVRIPFDFVAGGKRMPAGQYRVSGSLATGLISIQGGSAAKSMMLLSIPGSTLGEDRQLGVRFERVDGEPHLASLTIEGQAVRLVKVKAVRDIGAGSVAAGH